MGTLSVREVIVVEGKYDRIRLQAAVKATIVETNGFRIFKDPEQRELLRRLGPCGTTTRWCSSRCWTGLQAHKHAPGQTAGGVIEAISGDF